MARNDSSDNEFDPEMEGILHEHFESEASDLRSPSDPWVWLESRLEEPEPASFFFRFLGGLNPLREFRLSPAFAGAGVAVIAVAIAATVWTISSSDGPETSGGMAATAPTEAPAGAPTAATSPSTDVAPAPTSPLAGAEADEPKSDLAGAQEGERPTEQAAIAVGPTPVPAVTTVPVPGATVPPVPTQAAMTSPEPTVVMESIMAYEEAEELTSTSAPAPLATRAPSATPAAFHAQSATPSPAEFYARSSAPAPPAVTFGDYQRQPFVVASEDNVSTFSLDTDRTSFHLALNWARSGYVIDPDSVRAEEWLNSFDYDYDPPSVSDEFAVDGELFPHPLDEGRRLARLAFQAPELVVDRPLNVTLVLDASGSMGHGNRVAIARQAAESIRQSLRPGDRIAVVHFTGYILDQYTVEHSPPEDSRVQGSISWLQPHGSTNVQAGLDLGVQMAAEARELRPNAYNYVILMSDGVANVDATDPFGILETAYDSDDRNPLRLITIGVGIPNYNDLLLELLAQHGNGWYRYLDSTEQAQATFTRDNWLALSTPFADQTRAQVTWSTEAVERWRIIGYENRVTADENFAQDRKEFAEIYSGATTTVLYELELTETALSRSGVDLGRVELRWVDPATGDSRSQSAALSGSPGADFVGEEGVLAHFGAIVALAADTYGLLPSAQGEVSSDVHRALSALQVRLESLSGQLGTLDAYSDFSFVLDHMTAGVE